MSLREESKDENTNLSWLPEYSKFKEKPDSVIYSDRVK
jgi:hypothetical protein